MTDKTMSDEYALDRIAKVLMKITKYTNDEDVVSEIIEIVAATGRQTGE